ncbi:MAG TPA: hypothetical protein VEC01_18320 [Noviherbaspirillum sp.]|uniref:hypothetical protein n=1 Tax=Noviherbaspirillum sp. TaxID=1926288 RepID=UPI002D66A38E|nr:hypothetical protein [Noviherbaspirillum sp.]HYD97286.1 hypothetical protein [Noviherbaspirillum sp.]
MIRRLAPVFVLAVLVLPGCLTRQPVPAAASDFPERKAYLGCALARAFPDAAQDASEDGVMQAAMWNCRSEREALQAALNAEHPGNPGAARACMDELEAVLLEHMALRLAQVRRKALPGLTI